MSKRALQGMATSRVSQSIVKAVGAGIWGQQLTVTSVTLPRPSSPGEARRESPVRTSGGQPCSRECSCFRNRCALGTLPTTQQPPPPHPRTAPSPPTGLSLSSRSTRRATSPACPLIGSCARTRACARVIPVRAGRLVCTSGPECGSLYACISLVRFVYAHVNTHLDAGVAVFRA